MEDRKLEVVKKIPEPEFCDSCGEALLPDEAICAACGALVGGDAAEEGALDERYVPSWERIEVRIGVVVAVIIVITLGIFGYQSINDGPGDSITGVGSHTDQVPTVENPGEGRVVE